MNHNTCYPAFPLLGCQGQHEGSAGASFELSSFFSYPGQSHIDPHSMHIKRCGLHPLPFFLWPDRSYKNASLELSAYHLWKQTLWVSLNQLGAFSSSAALQCWGAQLNWGSWWLPTSARAAPASWCCEGDFFGQEDNDLMQASVLWLVHGALLVWVCRWPPLGAWLLMLIAQQAQVTAGLPVEVSGAKIQISMCHCGSSLCLSAVGLYFVQLLSAMVSHPCVCFLNAQYLNSARALLPWWGFSWSEH